jgi:uncharacterized glyoxalase superfamily protein PhnB
VKLTPVLMLDDIESALPFWVDRLGFEKTVEVPDGDRLGFVMLVRGGAELMLQTWSSAEKDLPGVAPRARPAGTGLFLEVDDFAEFRTRVAGCEIVVPERTTFYGMREIGVRAPGGHDLLIAAPVEK